MANDRTAIVRLEAGSPHLPVLADWRYDAFFKGTDVSLEESRRQLLTIAGSLNGEVALVAEHGGVPAGLCLYVHNEIDAAHDLTPWLASLYVVPEFRMRGIGRALVTAIEDHARGDDAGRLHLYTIGAEAFYRRCGWVVADRFDWHGKAFVLMHKDL